MSDQQSPSPAWSQFRNGALPCASCGVEVPGRDPERISTLRITTGLRKEQLEERTNEFRLVESGFEKLVSRCDTCQQIHLAAADLVAANPQVRGMIGDPEIAVWRTELALLALDAMGTRDARVIDNMTRSPQAIMKLIGAFAALGGAAMWTTSARARGGRRASSTPPSGTRWGHITPELRRELNEANVRFYVASNEKPAAFACPSDDGRPSGCLLCGVEAWEALPSYEREHGVWAEGEADPASIGGQGAESVDGYLCPRCDRACDAAGGIGQSAMSRSVLDYLGAGPFADAYGELGNLRGWGVMPRGTAPNREPWGHLFLDAVREDVRAFATGSGAAYGDYQPLQRLGFIGYVPVSSQTAVR